MPNPLNQKKVTINFNNKSLEIGGPKFTLIAGPCALESEDLVFETAEKLIEICQKLNINFIFKTSLDKANRSSKNSFRGLGLQKGLEIFTKLKKKYQIPILSDVHEVWQINEVKETLNVLQIPAFLARQTDLLIAAAQSGLPVNVKKGQFMAPQDMQNVIKKMEDEENFKGLMLCERGTSFGYQNLVVDMRSLAIMGETGWPIIYDATHSVQLPSASGTCSSGERQFIPYLTRAAVAVGINGLFMETHPNPEKALCDGPNQWPLDKMEIFLKEILAYYNLKKINNF